MIKELRHSEFRTWLLSFPGFYVVGMRGSANSCPIANYLRITNKKSACLNSSTVLFYNIGIAMKTPGWAAKFMKIIDSGGRQNDKVLASEALQVLHTVVRLKHPL